MLIPNFVSREVVKLIEMHPQTPKNWSQAVCYITKLQKLEEHIIQVKTLYLRIWGLSIIRTRLALWSILFLVRYEREAAMNLLRNGETWSSIGQLDNTFDFEKWHLEYIIAAHNLLFGMNLDPQEVEW